MEERKQNGKYNNLLRIKLSLTVARAHVNMLLKLQLHILEMSYLLISKLSKACLGSDTVICNLFQSIQWQ